MSAIVSQMRCTLAPRAATTCKQRPLVRGRATARRRLEHTTASPTHPPTHGFQHQNPQSQESHKLRRGAAHLDVGHPAVVVGLPLHPALKDLARPRHVAQHLLHVDVLVPQLVDAWQQRHCSPEAGQQVFGSAEEGVGPPLVTHLVGAGQQRHSRWVCDKKTRVRRRTGVLPATAAAAACTPIGCKGAQVSHKKPTTTPVGPRRWDCASGDANIPSHAPARSQMLRAWLMKRCRISISTYLSHRLTLLQQPGPGSGSVNLDAVVISRTASSSSSSCCSAPVQ